MGKPIWVRGLGKGYRGRPAVAGLDLEVADGEVLALLGPNGAGKTTTVEILAGLRRRDAGEVRVLGRDPWRAGRRWRERVGVVAQEPLGHGELTVSEHLASTAMCYPRPYDVAELLATVDLDGGRRIATLSGGQRRRLDVALGIVGRPELLFLDEPTTGFDPQARRDMWQLIRTLAATGTTVLLTTHYLDEAEQLADRVAVLVRGRIVALDAPRRLGRPAQRTATVGWCEDGAARHRTTDEPARLISELACRFGGEVPELTVTRPSLEDVYLDLIGAAR